MRALVCINTRARRGADALRQMMAALDAAGIETVRGEGPVEACILAHKAKVDLVIVGGGDGSLNQAAEAVRETGLPLGIIPLGTANDLARTLTIPTDLAAAVDVIARGKTHAIDVGDVNGKLFFNVASIGFSAELARELTADIKKRWGTLGYLLAAMRLVRQKRPFTAWIEQGGETVEVRTFQVSVGNGRFYGGGLAVAENARADDGKLDLYSLEVGHWSGLVALLPFMKWGWHGRWSPVRTGTGKVGDTMTVRTKKPRPVNADGEIVSETPAVFRVHPKAVRVFVP